jgi:uncharacterized protein DUF4124
MRYIVFILLFLLCSTMVQAQVYKWVDEDGNTQYTDQPPPSGAAENEKKLKIRSAPPSTANVESDKSTGHVDEKDEFNKRREERLENQSKMLAQEEENERRCVDAQGRIKMLQISSRLTMPDGKGGITYVDDDMRLEQIKNAQAEIDTFCK